MIDGASQKAFRKREGTTRWEYNFKVISQMQTAENQKMLN